MTILKYSTISKFTPLWNVNIEIDTFKVPIAYFYKVVKMSDVANQLYRMTVPRMTFAIAAW